MCHTIEIPALSPLPAFEIPEDNEPILDSESEEELDSGTEPEEEGPVIRNPLRTAEDGQQYWAHPRYVNNDVVPKDMRFYVNSDDDEDEDEDMRSFLGDYHRYDEDEQMSDHGNDEQERMVEDTTEQVGEELTAPIPPPTQLPPPSRPRSEMMAEDRLWERLQVVEALLQERDEQILYLHSKGEYAKRNAQHWEHAAKRIATGYRLTLDKSWRSINCLRTAEGPEQTPASIEQMASYFERQYDSALANEEKMYRWVRNH